MQTAKLVLDEHFLGESDNFTSGIEYFNYEEEPSFSITSTPHVPRTPLATVNALGRELSLDSAATSESEETYKPRPISEELCSAQQGRHRLYRIQFLEDQSEGGFYFIVSVDIRNFSNDDSARIDSNLRFHSLEDSVSCLGIIYRACVCYICVFVLSFLSLRSRPLFTGIICVTQFQKQENLRTSFCCCVPRAHTRNGPPQIGRAYKRNVPI